MLGPDALLLATEPSTEGGPAAELPALGTPLVRRLIEQLRSFGADRVWVVTRPEWSQTLREACRTEVEVVTAASLSDELRLVADLAETGEGALVLTQAHLLLHREALAGLVADPRIASGALVAGSGVDRSSSFPVAYTPRAITSAASRFHRVERPTGSFRGLVKLDGPDRPAVATIARELAELARKPRPREWEEALQRSGSDSPDDGLALLLVGLVRCGVDLFPVDLRGFFQAAPRSSDAVEAAADEMSRRDEEALLLDSAVKANDSFFTAYLVSPWSKYLARFAARRGWTPNALTAVSFTIGLVAAAAFAYGTRVGLVAGAVLLQVSFVIDCIDGQVARYTRSFSNLGGWLDSVFDRLKEYAVYGGLAVGAARGFDDDVWVLAAAALSLQTFRHLSELAYAARLRGASTLAPHAPLTQSGDERLSPELAFSAGAESPRRRRGASAALWAHRTVQLPIGERFAMISLAAAVASPRVTFVALLAFGGLAAVYGLAGRIMLTVARPRRILEAVLN